MEEEEEEEEVVVVVVETIEAEEVKQKIEYNKKIR